MAGSGRRGPIAMTKRENLQTQAEIFDFYNLMRILERSHKEHPRIGQNITLKDEIVTLEQDPFLAFPRSNVVDYQEVKGSPLSVGVRFLGFFGPQGALPLTTTAEAYNWSSNRDPSFARFTNIFATRFLQLFYRAWADARPVAQLDRPESDRFFDYLASFAGIGSRGLSERDSFKDIHKVAFSGLTNPSIKSAVRLQQLLRGALGVRVEIVERVGMWLDFEADDCVGLGNRELSLGVNSFVGKRVYSINEKFRVKIITESMDEYKKLLPSGEKFRILSDLIYYYVGLRYEFDVQLLLGSHLAEPVSLGKKGELGWTTWISPTRKKGEYLDDARFSPGEHRKNMFGSEI